MSGLTLSSNGISSLFPPGTFRCESSNTSIMRVYEGVVRSMVCSNTKADGTIRVQGSHQKTLDMFWALAG